MIHLKTILVATDFSDTSEFALKYAKALAGAFHSQLHVVHVLQDPFAVAPYGEVYPAVLNDLRESLEKDSRAALERLLTIEEREKYGARLSLVWGTPFLEIVRYTKDHNIDLVVMGTHGRGPIQHVLLGSVAEKVVRKSPSPVLTVRPSGHQFVMP